MLDCEEWPAPAVDLLGSTFQCFSSHTHGMAISVSGANIIDTFNIYDEA